jgi:hypothetical protein
MFIVTDEAVTELKTMLDEADDRPAGHTFRIGYDETDRLGLAWDKPVAGDRHIQSSNETVLLLDEDVWARLDDVVMDVVETVDGPRLKLYRQTD